MWAALSTVREALAATPPGDLVKPDQDWRSVFLGPGFDPADGRSRSDMLMRAPDTLFACSRMNGAVAGVGALSVWKDWGGLQGMRTAADARGGGHARAVIRALVEAAGRREVARLYLSVQAANAPALRLYSGLSFQLAYDYDYWRPR